MNEKCEKSKIDLLSIKRTRKKSETILLKNNSTKFSTMSSSRAKTKKSPVMAVFDLDATIIETDDIVYKEKTDVRNHIYDPDEFYEYMKGDHQIAFATWNQEDEEKPDPVYVGGKRMVRKVVDSITRSKKESQKILPDEFIEAWAPFDADLQHEGKNTHLLNLSKAYERKYGCLPHTILLFDDNIHNVYLANAMDNVIAFWTPKGFRSSILPEQITYMYELRVPAKADVRKAIGEYEKYLYREDENSKHKYYSLYLPGPPLVAQKLKLRISGMLKKAKITNHIKNKLPEELLIFEEDNDDDEVEEDDEHSDKE